MKIYNNLTNKKNSLLYINEMEIRPISNLSSDLARKFMIQNLN